MISSTKIKQSTFNTNVRKIESSEKALLLKLKRSKANINKFKVGIASFDQQTSELDSYEKSLDNERKNYLKILSSINKIKAKKVSLKNKVKREINQKVSIVKKQYLDKVDKNQRHTESLKLKSINFNQTEFSQNQSAKNIIDIIIY